MMRSAPLLLVMLAIAGGCASRPAEYSTRIQTSDEANRENLGGAVSAPLRDLNVLRTKIPPVLLDAASDPYARPRRVACPDLATLVRGLDEALGPDIDLGDDENLTLAQKGREDALGAVAGITQDVIPFRGWMRRLTGAEQHDRLVQSAIEAGMVRRAYLKGLGESKGCRPPAAPSHSRTPTPLPAPQLRPRG